MAWIENSDTKHLIYLNASHVFGRNASACCTHISDEAVSRLHATIRWTGSCWVLEDHSRNGTFLSDKVIRKTAETIREGDCFRFGSLNAGQWLLVDESPPLNYLKSMDIQNRVLLLENTVFFKTQIPSETLFFRSADRRWVAKTAGEPMVLTHGMQLSLNNERWMFIENEISLTGTIDYGEVLKNSYFKFCVSTTEEDIRLKLVTDGLEYDMGRRAYNYLLLTLCRKRLADMKRGFLFGDQGWISIDELEKNVSKEVGHYVDSYYLNLQVYRFRKNLIEMKPFGYLLSNVIERRMGELRFAFPQLKVFKADECIGEIVC